ncbi:MAG TPA: hypothetical protein VI636_14815 [Candidatus Angelobacter sp.]
MMKNHLVLIAAVLMPVGTALAQASASDENGPIVIAGAQSSSGEKNQNFTYIEKLPSSADPLEPEDMRLIRVMTEASKVVKNAPYTASEVTETTQTLGDGNRIVKETTASVARDAEGRTRREENVVKIGSLQGTGPKIVTISDPVAHTEYMFQPKESAGTGSVVFNSGEGVGIGMGASGSLRTKVRTFNLAKGDSTHSVEFGATNERGTKTWITMEQKEAGGDADLKRESLGTQTIEGVTAEGTRDTRTIPAGAIGNEKPIMITSEIWTSPDLQVVVLSKRNDPRFGETVYKLTGITRGEPDPSLFQPPGNLKKEIHGQTKY